MRTIEPCDLTPAQRKEWGVVLSMLTIRAPGFKYLFYNLVVNNKGEFFAIFTKSIPVAATDSKNILVNPDTFFSDTYTTEGRMFIIAHEIAHVMYNDVALLWRAMKTNQVPMHDGTVLPFDWHIMQVAADYRINDTLVQGGIGKCPDNGFWDSENYPASMSVIDIYQKLYNERAGDDGNGKKGDGKGNGKPGKGDGDGFDIILEPGESMGEEPSDAQLQNPQQLAVAVTQAKSIEQINAAGKMRGALQRMFDDILEPEVSWQDHLQSECSRKLGSNGYNWRKADRRFIGRDLFMPSRSGFGCGWVVVWCDMSGSVVAQAEKYLAELHGILEDARPRRLTVIWADDGIAQIDEMTDVADLLEVKRKGIADVGGGTSVHPVLKWIDEGYEAPDMFLAFTDGYFDFPSHAPTYPVIWASVTDAKYPWGTVVRINPVKREYQ